MLLMPAPLRAITPTVSPPSDTMPTSVSDAAAAPIMNGVMFMVPALSAPEIIASRTERPSGICLPSTASLRLAGILLSTQTVATAPVKIWMPI